MSDPRIADWPTDEGQARVLQHRLASRVREQSLAHDAVTMVAGVDVTYADEAEQLVAAAVVLRLPDLAVVEESWTFAHPRFPYVPGLFAFREVPPLLDVIDTLTVTPDLVVCDGNGRAHPRRFGLASHLGVLLDRPVVGVAKSPFVPASAPDRQRGSWTDLTDHGEVVGRVLRTRDDVRPVYVSVGHRVDLSSATDLVLRLTPRFRVPEPIRRSDQLSRTVLGQFRAASASG